MLGASKCLPLVLDVTNVRAAQEVPRPGTLTARIPDNNAKLPWAYLGLHQRRRQIIRTANAYVALTMCQDTNPFKKNKTKIFKTCYGSGGYSGEICRHVASPCHDLSHQVSASHRGTCSSCTHALLSPLFRGILQGDKIETMGQLPFTTHLSSDLGGSVLFYSFIF